MSEWRFRVTPGIIPRPLLEQAYFAGWGRVPYLTQTNIQGDELILQSECLGSGTIHVPAFHAPLGVVMESTDTLLGQSEPYLLVRELARGALGRLSRRIFDWQILGFQHPEALANRGRYLAQRFSGFIVKDPFLPETEQNFVSILEELSQLIVDENKAFAEQTLSWRTRNNTRLPIILGVKMDAPCFETFHEFDAYAKLLDRSFYAVVPMPTWRELEPRPGQFDWDRLEKQLVTPTRFGFQVVLGPLLSFSADMLPEWLVPQLDKEGYFEAKATQFVNTVAEQYGYLAHSWILANRFTDQSLPGMPLERILLLIQVLSQQLRSRGIDTPIGVGIGQPWGEYAVQQVPEWEQIHIAETLMGCRDIDVFLLEMDFGNGKHRTLPRDPMAVGYMIDQWSFLGKQVYVSLSVPSGGNFFESASELPQNMSWSEERQRTWTEALLLTLLGKHAVKGIFWSCLQDPMVPAESVSECNYGLINAQQALKPAFKHFAAARKNLLQ